MGITQKQKDQMEKLTIEMPFPPTINQYRTPINRGKFITLILSKSAREYSENVPSMIFDKDRKPFAGRIKLTIYHTMPSNHGRDLDNFNKGVLDAITKARVWEDDKQVDILTNVRSGVLPPGNTIATIEEIERQEQKVGKSGWKYYYPGQDFIDQEPLEEIQESF